MAPRAQGVAVDASVTAEQSPGWQPGAAVILVNLGSPRAPTPAAVAAFLAEFLSDQRVVELPRLLWQPVLRGIVIPLRAKRVAHAYASIWDGDSPLRAIALRQRERLQQRLRASLGDAAPWVRLAMSYQGPSIAATIEDCQRRGIERIVVLPLYPQYSATTTAAVFDQVARHLLHTRSLPGLHLVRDYHDAPGYIAALAASVREHWDSQGRGAHLLLSFHGIPEVNVRKGDPYARQCERTARLLADELGLGDGDWTLAYQSRFGRQRWLMPYTNETLHRLAADGVRSVDVLCPAFAADCLETLEEMVVENRAVFLEAGGAEYRFIACLNDRDDHIAMLHDIVLASGCVDRRARDRAD
ncbi:MAG: Ferrochelatase [Pseudomonadales bacterium]|nr:Ferrochelatase [Pseudomonadales bacterium]